MPLARVGAMGIPTDAALPGRRRTRAVGPRASGEPHGAK
jgi:hypothetical protein